VAIAKILVIDDDRSIRHLLDVHLRQKGYDVVLAENGPRGLELFHQELPDIIVLDFKMPGMDGLAVLNHLRRTNPNQAVIMFTGTLTSKAEQQIRALAVTEIVKKESSQDSLDQALKRVLKTSRPDQARAQRNSQATSPA
jgi:DNA-binding response OmpR family regulator